MRIRKSQLTNCYEFSVVIRDLILTSFSFYAPKVGFISPDLRHLDLNFSALTFLLVNRKRLVTLGLVHVMYFKLLNVPSLLTELKVVKLFRTLGWTGEM